MNAVALRSGLANSTRAIDRKKYSVSNSHTSRTPRANRPRQRRARFAAHSDWRLDAKAESRSDSLEELEITFGHDLRLKLREMFRALRYQSLALGRVDH